MSCETHPLLHRYVQEKNFLKDFRHDNLQKVAPDLVKKLGFGVIFVLFA